MNINNIIEILEIIRGFIMSDIYDAEAMRELDPDENYPSQSAQLRAIKQAIYFLRKLDNFTKSIVYFNSHKEV